MTKQEYVVLRKQNPAIVLYKKYVENHNPSKHGRLLGEQEFFIYLNMWTNVNALLQKTIEEYDAIFAITHVLDKHGNYIKTL